MPPCLLDPESAGLGRPSSDPNRPRRPNEYPTDPVGYARDILGVTLTPDQETILRGLLEPPHRVFVKSGHNLGKTFVSAVAVNWWWDSFDPGVVITTAPTERDVVDLLWTEVRLQRQRAGLPCHFIGDRGPEMRTSEDHWAKGWTARTGESFQGRHRRHMLFVFDECEGVSPTYWTTTRTMFKPELDNSWLVIGNPTTTTSQAALEEHKCDGEGKPSWRVLTMSALEHPNVTAQLRGEPAPIPEAVTLSQVDAWVQEWCEKIAASERRETDFEWRPGSGQWWHPGPIAEPRILGRRPSQGVYGVWSEALWDAAAAAEPQIPAKGTRPEIGCDVARFGDDFTAMHVRWDITSFHHEEHNGWDVVRTVDRLQELCILWANRATKHLDPGSAPVRPEEILVKIDDDGVGAGVIDLLRSRGYAAIGVGAGRSATLPHRYPNVRSELWFATVDRARSGLLRLAHLGRETLARLRQQALAPTWQQDTAGRRVVEPKDVTKKKLGRSPDGLDAKNLAYFSRPSPYPNLKGQG